MQVYLKLGSRQPGIESMSKCYTWQLSIVFLLSSSPTERTETETATNVRRIESETETGTGIESVSASGTGMGVGQGFRWASVLVVFPWVGLEVCCPP